MTQRNVVCISHLDPEIHQWLREEAARRTADTGKRVAFWQVMDEALRRYKEKFEEKALIDLLQEHYDAERVLKLIGFCLLYQRPGGERHLRTLYSRQGYNKLKKQLTNLDIDPGRVKIFVEDTKCPPRHMAEYLKY